MGLLSDPKKRQKIVDAIAKYNNKLCLICYVAGVAWFLALAYTPLNASTYFSENALLPGLVDNGYRQDSAIKSYLEELRTEMKNNPKSAPREWIYNKFTELGLDTFYHNYTIQYPLNLLRGQAISGQNVHAVLRARRASSTEAIIMSVPLRSKESDLSPTIGGLALMLSLAKYFRTQTYWAKDIIFLATDHEQIGMQAWLNGYHQIESEFIIPGEVHGKAGSIQAALNLEISGELNLYYNVKIEGLNGQLPNLDLVNLIVRLCHVEKAVVALHHQRDSFDQESFDGYMYSLQTMMKMMWAQASGLPSGNHGLFHRYHIEAVTLEGIKKKKGQGGYSFGTVISGRIVEGVMRSMNNLLERFHQSFFFYILPGTNRYISIGLYMPPFGLICAAALIKAIALWIAVGSAKKSEEISKPEAKDLLEEMLEKEDHQGDESSEDEEEQMNTPDSKFISILPPILTSVLMGLIAFVGPTQLAELSVPFKMRIEDGISVGIMALFVASLFFPKMINKQAVNERRLHFDWQLLKCIALIFQSLVLFSVALMNISLAVILAVGLVPISLLVSPSKNFLYNLFQNCFLLLVSPASMIFIASLIASSGEQYRNTIELIFMAWEMMKQGILLTMIDRFLFGSWLFALFSFALLPNWLLLWSIAHSPTF